MNRSTLLLLGLGALAVWWASGSRASRPAATEVTLPPEQYKGDPWAAGYNPGNPITRLPAEMGTTWYDIAAVG